MNRVRPATKKMTREEFYQQCQHCNKKVILPDGTRLSKGKYLTKNGFNYDQLFEDLDHIFVTKFEKK